jgi:hypothetical protein
MFESGINLNLRIISGVCSILSILSCIVIFIAITIQNKFFNGTVFRSKKKKIKKVIVYMGKNNI